MPRKQTEEIDLEGLLRDIRQDPKFRLFRNIVITAERRLHIDADRNEVFALNAARISRKLRGRKNYNPSLLVEVSADEMGIRTRIVEIRTKSSYHIEVVEKAMEAFSDYVITEYNEDLKNYGTEAQRKSFIRRTQKIADTVVTDGKGLLDMCDKVISDIDKSSYHISNMVELLKQLSQSIGGKVV